MVAVVGETALPASCARTVLSAEERQRGIDNASQKVITTILLVLMFI